MQLKLGLQIISERVLWKMLSCLWFSFSIKDKCLTIKKEELASSNHQSIIPTMKLPGLRIHLFKSVSLQGF